MATTREVLLDYIRYRLNEEGFCGAKLNKIRDLFAGLPTAETPAMNELRCVGRKMECNIYNAAALDLAEKRMDLTGECAKAIYLNILAENFSDRMINWGRLVLVIVYTGRLAVQAMRLGCTIQVRNLVDWCESYFKDNFLDQWIEANGGWDRHKGLNKCNWENRDAIKEFGCYTLGLTAIVGVMATAYYILKNKS